MTDDRAARLTERTTSGALLLVVTRLATRGIDFVALTVLARLLGPAEFGIVAIALSLVQIVEAVLEMPVGQVLVRQDRIERAHIDTAFTLGLLRGLILALALAAIAVPIADLYGDRRLLLLLPIMAVAPAARGMRSPEMILFSLRLDFRRESVADIAGKLTAFSTSVLAAIWLRDYRALVISALTAPIVEAATSYVIAPYRPRLSLAAWPAFARFVGWTTASQLFMAISWQCDRLALGRVVSTARLGEFSLANDLAYLPEQSIVTPILRPLMAAFATIRDDRDRLQLAYAMTAAAVLALGAPVMIGLSLLAGPAVQFALGGRWIAAVPILQWLALTLIIPLFISPMGPLAQALGRPDIPWRQSLIEASFKLPLTFAGAFLWGIDGVIAARVLATCVAAASSFYHVRQLIGTAVLRQVAASWRIVLSAVLLAGVLLVLRPLLAGRSELMLAVMLPVVSGAGLAVYLVSLGALWHVAGRPGGLEAMAFERIMSISTRRSRDV